MFYKEADFKEEPLIGEIPKNWDSVDLGEVVEIHDSKRIPLSEMERNQRKGKYPYCGANGIIDYIDDYIFDGEFVLLAEDGGSYGRFENTAYIMSEKFWVNNHAHILRAMEGKTINQFLKHVLDCLDLNPYIVGSTRKKLNQEQMREIRLPLPPLSEQRAVVGVLGVVDLAIAKAGEVIAKTERLKKGLIQELLTKGIGHKEYKQTPIGKTPKTWQVSRLGDTVKVQGGFAFKSADYVDEGVPLIRIANVSFGHVEFEDLAKLPNSYFDTYQEFALEENDIVIVLTRPIIEGGIKAAKIEKRHTPSLLNQRVGRFRIIDRGKILPDFLFHIVFSDNFVKQVKKGLVTMNQPNISPNEIGRFRILLPPLPEQQQISEILSTIDAKLELEKSEKAQLERVKRGLMDLLLTGKVRVKVD